MSIDEPTPPTTPLPPARPQGMGGCMVAFLVLIGVVLLLPGICSLLFMGASGVKIGADIAGLMLLTLAIAAGGIALIVFAVRNR
jgi:hypothetical protein